MLNIEDGFLIIDDLQFEYRRIGNNKTDSPTLVFLHEGLGSVSMWKDFPEQLAEATGLDAFIYSRQSYGKSSPLPVSRKSDYMHDEALDILPKVLDQANIKNAILVGHSDGASIALLFAGSNIPPVPCALVLMAPHVFNEDLSIKSIALAKQAFENSDLRERLGVYHNDVDNAFWRWNDIWLHSDFKDWNIENCLRSITAPMLVIQGEDDEYGTDAQIHAIQEKCGGTVETLILSDCKHAPFRDQNEATTSGISYFIEQSISAS
jgi:pimeloyl-ACP methyl ester carboxylesterase